MSSTNSTYTQWLQRFGIGLIVLNTTLLILSIKFGQGNRGQFFFDDDAYFWIGYIATAIYFITLHLGRLSFKRKKIDYPLFRLHCLSLVSFSISAYLLNRSLTVFSEFVPWSIGFIILMHLLLLIMAFWQNIPRSLDVVFGFLTGICIWLCISMSVHTAPIWPIAFIGSFFFGISMHALVPLFILLTFIWFSYKNLRSIAARWSLAAGLTIPLIFLVIFFMRWGEIRSYVHEAHASQITMKDNKLADWVLMSQLMNEDWITERVIIGEFAYATARNFDQLGISRSENVQYDPLVSMALLMFDDLNISRADRQKIIEAQFDGRHDTHRRLWRGTHLKTTEVLTEVEVFPEFAHAYIEKTLFIQNQHSHQGNQQEAVYTFYVPEGAVATSLSLWVNGQEEKSRLTTKAKADSAYVQIVGREMRDPALLHWQEGNRITVTVFPCTPAENRRFKVGWTVPMDLKKEEFKMENIYFKGPDFSDALETTVVKIHSEGDHQVQLPSRFELIASKTYQSSGQYQPDWSIDIGRTDLSAESFQFGEYRYTLKENEYENEEVDIDRVYLDINSLWTDDELKVAFETFEPKKTFINANGLVNLEEQGSEKLIDRLRRHRFSLFPFQLLDEDENSVVITKSTANSPALNDLENCRFEQSVREFMKNREMVPDVIDLAEDRSPYLQTLSQFRQIDLHHADMESAAEMIRSGTLPRLVLGPDEVEIGAAAYSIRRDTATVGSNNTAPDHLMRLYNYNRILRDMNSSYFDADKYQGGELLEMANSAFVVTPISSLVVLETQKDYERFDIDKNKNSLQNASAGSSGAVPEPHEWALIFLALGVVLYFKFRA